MTKSRPEIQNWVALFVDGIKMLIVEIVYFLPVILLWIIGMALLGPHAAGSYVTPGPYNPYLASSPVAAHGTAHPTIHPTAHPTVGPSAYPTIINNVMAVPGYSTAGMAGAGILGLLNLLLTIAISILLPIALITFARSGNFRDAFDIKAILGHIGRIGWLRPHHCPDHRGSNCRHPDIHYHVRYHVLL